MAEIGFRQPIIRLQHVTKTFPARRGTRDLRGRGGLGDWLRGYKEAHFTALTDITFEVYAGESLGIIGRNGSGKSTLLSLIAGVTLPTSGTVEVFGRVASLLELGAGFNPVLTGRENIYLNAGLLGMRRAQVDKVYDDIVRFSGIADFIDQPVETYSSGMYVRIGFSVAAFVNPDIFLADEVLAVGDAEFQHKCRNRIGELREQGKTIVFVSHDLGIVNTLCERVILLDKGRMIQRETPQKTIAFYLRQVGREKGIHTFAEGDMEAIFCDGRISLFHRQEEITASTGFRVEMISLGQYHSSTEAEWVIEESDSKGCRARGKMLRLPVTLVWNMHLLNGGLSWQIQLEMNRECPIHEVMVQLFFPITYVQWLFNDQSGTFPDILPIDNTWDVVAAPQSRFRETACLPESNTSLPAIVISLEEKSEVFKLVWLNTDYITLSRVLCIQARFPEHACISLKGEQTDLSIHIDLITSREHVKEKICPDRTLRNDQFTLSFDSGKIKLLLNNCFATPPQDGFRMEIVSENKAYFSTDAEWEFLESNPRERLLKGRLRRRPINLLWRFSIEGKRLKWTLSLEVLENCSLQEIVVIFPLILDYLQWSYGDFRGTFPEITSADLHWNIIATSEIKPRKAAFYSSESSSLPPLIFHIEQRPPFFDIFIANSDYANSSRILRLSSPIPEEERTFGKGIYPCFEIGLELGATREEALQKIYAEKTLRSGRLMSRFEHGRILLWWEDSEVTFYHGVYNSMLVSHLWNDSQILHWSDPIAIRNGILLRGVSRRFPFAQEWEITARDETLFLRITLEAMETFEVQEYHTSIVLPPYYMQWETSHEKGIFPDFDKNITNWVHCNRMYAPGTHITAFSDSMPSVSLITLDDSPTVCMTAINTSYFEHGRVLQALRPSGFARLFFPVGKHVIFVGKIVIGTTEVGNSTSF